MSELGDEKALELLAQLSEHFGEPVRPVSEYCASLREWQRAVQQGAYDQESPEDVRAELTYIADAINVTFTAITKSCLLARTLYGGQKLRTEKCPVHKGHWSGCHWESPSCANAQYPDGCMDGSSITGWLPTEDERQAQVAWHAKRLHVSCSDCGKRYHVGPAGDHQELCPYCHPGTSFNFPCFCVSSHIALDS